MRKMFKKAVALALAAVMMIPMMGISASAEDNDGYKLVYDSNTQESITCLNTAVNSTRPGVYSGEFKKEGNTIHFETPNGGEGNGYGLIIQKLEHKPTIQEYTFKCDMKGVYQGLANKTKSGVYIGVGWYDENDIRLPNDQNQNISIAHSLNRNEDSTYTTTLTPPEGTVKISITIYFRNCSANEYVDISNIKLYRPYETYQVAVTDVDELSKMYDVREDKAIVCASDEAVAWTIDNDVLAIGKKYVFIPTKNTTIVAKAITDDMKANGAVVTGDIDDDNSFHVTYGNDVDADGVFNFVFLAKEGDTYYKTTIAEEAPGSGQYKYTVEGLGEKKIQSVQVERK